MTKSNVSKVTCNQFQDFVCTHSVLFSGVASRLGVKLIVHIRGLTQLNGGKRNRWVAIWLHKSKYKSWQKDSSFLAKILYWIFISYGVWISCIITLRMKIFYCAKFWSSMEHEVYPLLFWPRIHGTSNYYIRFLLSKIWVFIPNVDEDYYLGQICWDGVRVLWIMGAIWITLPFGYKFYLFAKLVWARDKLAGLINLKNLYQAGFAWWSRLAGLTNFEKS